jgi:hypothetical protein
MWMLLILYSPITTSMEERQRCYFFVPSRRPHKTTEVSRVNEGWTKAKNVVKKKSKYRRYRVDSIYE